MTACSRAELKEPCEKPIGQVAYEAYCVSVFDAFGDRMPSWREVKDDYRAVWESVARAVAKEGVPRA